ncbi:MAG: PIN domain-containing protein [Geminicoccaceae bacterium]
MFANRFTALIDACVLVGALKRNILLSLAEAELFRPRWSERILAETERTICEILDGKGDENAGARAARARRSMEIAFEDAIVSGHESLETSLFGLPDENDRHVVAAALKTRASVIVTDNLKDFPDEILAPLDLEALSADEFIANTIDLDPHLALGAMKRMRERLNNPGLSPEQFILTLERTGLLLVADMIERHRPEWYP